MIAASPAAATRNTAMKNPQFRRSPRAGRSAIPRRCEGSSGLTCSRSRTRRRTTGWNRSGYRWLMFAIMRAIAIRGTTAWTARTTITIDLRAPIRSPRAGIRPIKGARPIDYRPIGIAPSIRCAGVRSPGRGSAGVHRHRRPHPNLARGLASRLHLRARLPSAARRIAGELKPRAAARAAASNPHYLEVPPPGGAYAALDSSIACCTASIRPVLAASRKSTSRTCMGSRPLAG